MLFVVADALAGAAGHAAAAPALRLAAVFGDHMVLQRGQPVRLWGTGAPGRTVRAAIAGEQGFAPVDAAGRWQLQLPPLPAGGPHMLRVDDGSTQVHHGDILFGDVWLCGGQSNMAWPLEQSAGGGVEAARASLPAVRHLRVPARAGVQPASDIPAARWQPATPAVAGQFSAVGWHFAKRVHAETGIPVGLIHIAWNGSNLETWVRRAAALDDPDLAAAVRALPRDDADLATARAREVAARVASFQGDAPPVVATPDGPASDGGFADAAFDDGRWPTLAAPQPWESQGLAGLDGVVWYRRTVELTAAQAAGAATLHLAKVDDWDETWVNGEPVGATRHYDTPRRYALRAGLLKAGRNVIAVRVTDLGQGGGFHGSEQMLRLDTAAGPVPLAGRWRARVVRIAVAPTPEANDAPTLAHNTMVAPLAQLPVRGVLWYQGESNVARAERYAGAFRRLIVDWRLHFGQPVLPFLFVQLAPFGALRDDPNLASGWAALREAQQAALSLPATAMVVTTDAGDDDGDLHPKDKRTVGERLAGLALAMADPRRPAASGPVLRRVMPQGAAMVAEFDDHGLGLTARPAGAPLAGFAVAGADGRFHAAAAHIEGRRVVVSSPRVPEPVALRFGWADNPSRNNLVDGSGLPAAPFRSDGGAHGAAR